VHVSALDRLGRDAYDIQTTARKLTERGVRVRVLNFPAIEGVMAEFFFLVMAGMAQIEKQRINERTAAGKELAKELLRTTGETQHGKLSMGRPKAADEAAVRAWKTANSASHAETAKHFGLSVSTVRRYSAKG
jgi:putative DNA-invertase from lambdoid prophage Rac